MGDVAPTVDQHSDLAADLTTQFGELACEVVVEENVRVESSTEEALELLDLAGLQAAGIAVDLDCRLLTAIGFGSDAKTLALSFEICTGSVQSAYCSRFENGFHDRFDHRFDDRDPEGPACCEPDLGPRSLPCPAFSTMVGWWIPKAGAAKIVRLIAC